MIDVGRAARCAVAVRRVRLCDLRDESLEGIEDLEGLSKSCLVAFEREESRTRGVISGEQQQMQPCHDVSFIFCLAVERSSFLIDALVPCHFACLMRTSQVRGKS